MASQTVLACTHQHYLNNDVHKLALRDASNEAVDAAITHMNTILGQHDSSTPLLLMIDARNGVPSVPYFLGEVRKLYSAYAQLPQVRAAYLFEDSMLLSLIQATLNAMPLKANRNFIRGGKEVDALEWLLTND